MVWIRLLVGAAFLAAAAVVVAGRRHELLGAGSLIGEVRPLWLLVAIAAEALSVLAVMYEQQRLLKAGGVSIPAGSLAGITLAANALGTTLPGGQAWATVFTYRQYGRKGATPGVATWTLVAVAALSGGALALLAVGGVFAASDNGPSPAWGLWLLVGVTAVIAIGMAFALRHPRPFVRVIVRVVRAAGRLTRRSTERVALAVERATGQMLHVRPTAGTWTSAFVFASLNWLADCGCLCAAFLGIGAPVPWRGLLLAYAAGQLVTAAALTPGGIGVVEGSLTATLVAYGAGDVSTIAAVLLYRMISYWLLLAIGWPTWTFLHYRRAPAVSSAPPALVRGAPPEPDGENSP
jgi:uncharacterized membrane protein YbhN (UPF0104 family)